MIEACLTMKAQLLILLTSILAVHTSTVGPIDDSPSSTSSVEVNQKDNEYSSTIKENKEVPFDQKPISPGSGYPNPIDLIKNDDKNENKDKTEIQDTNDSKSMAPLQSQSPIDEMKMVARDPTYYELRGSKILEQKPQERYQIIPGYRLIPVSDQVLDYPPIYYPYIPRYPYHYPHLRFF